MAVESSRASPVAVLIAALLAVSCRTIDVGKQLEASECPAGTTWTEVTRPDGELPKEYQRSVAEPEEPPNRSTGSVVVILSPIDEPPKVARTFTFCLDEQGYRQGPQLVATPDGRISRSTFRDGIHHGLHQSWDEQGNTVRKDHYEDGEIVGRYRFGSEAETRRKSMPEDPVHPCPRGAIVGGRAPPGGRKQWCERDIGGGVYVRHGTEIEWQRDGALEERTEYRNGVPHGEHTVWENGVKKFTRSYSRGELEGSQWAWYENGKASGESVYANGVKIRETDWSPAGVKIDEALWDETGEPIVAERWYESGTQKALRRWQGGDLVEDRAWNPDGTLEQEILAPKGGMATERRWYANGNPKLERIGSSRSHGSERQWYENGNPKSEKHWKGGRIAGTSREWTEKGELAEEIVYGERGEVVTHRVTVLYEPELPDWVPAARERGDAVRPVPPLECPDGSTARERARDPGERQIPLGSLEGRNLMSTVVGYRVADWLAAHVLFPPLRIAATREAYCGSEVPHGPAAVFEPGGAPVFTGSYEKGKKHGTWVYWGPGGTKQGEVDFERDDIRRVTVWTPAGHLHSVQSFREGVRHGPTMQWHEESTAPWELYVYREGEKHGPYMRFRKDGRADARGEFRHGKGHGLSVSWGPLGERAETTWRNGKQSGPYAEYDPDGSLVTQGRYENSQKEGAWGTFRHGIRLTETQYAEGRKHGVERRYDDEGNLVVTTRYVSGKRDGPYRRYSRDGTLVESGQYVASKKDGIWVSYRPDGSKQRVGQYAADEMTGTWVYLNANGTRSAEGKYRPCIHGASSSEWLAVDGESDYRYYPRDGCRTGTWTFWNSEGLSPVERTFE